MTTTPPRQTNTEEEDEGVGGRRQGSQFPPDVLSALKLMFDGLDADCDGVLSREDVSGTLRVLLHLFLCLVFLFRKSPLADSGKTKS